MGLQDFAGGAVVHITAGVAALVAAMSLGGRRGFGQTAMPPHNLTMTVTGAGMLWVGWFGFNAGSAVAADSSAAMAMLVTHLSAACGSLPDDDGVVGHGKPSGSELLQVWSQDCDDHTRTGQPARGSRYCLVSVVATSPPSR